MSHPGSISGDVAHADDGCEANGVSRAGDKPGGSGSSVAADTRGGQKVSHLVGSPAASPGVSNRDGIGHSGRGGLVSDPPNAGERGADMDSATSISEAPQAPNPQSRRTRLLAEYRAIKPFVVISASYLLFTVTDGGIRTIVLFNAFQRKFSAFEVSIMFVLYELAGTFTNFLAGIAGARWGLKATMLAGLFLQLGGIGMLFGWSEKFTKEQAIIFVTIAQMLSGISKDLVKLGGKAVTKLVTPDSKQGVLYKRVSMITGLKNSLKGVGYFLGGALVQWSYFGALGVMMGIVLLAIPWPALGLESGLGRTRRENITWRSVFKKNHNIQALSAARFFLFASRDAWFDVPLPFYLRSKEGFGWERAAAAALLGAWIILYGQVQSWTPQLVAKPLKQFPANKYHAALWAGINAVIPLVLGCFLQFSDIFRAHDVRAMMPILLVGVFVFAIIFAINSSIHSYLAVKYSEGDKIAVDIGFYYMSNSAGRLFGTLVGGALFEFVGNYTNGFAACFWFSLCLTVVAAAITPALKDDAGGLRCGPCLTFAKSPENLDDDSGLPVERVLS
jgi:MFS family permease